MPKMKTNKGAHKRFKSAKNKLKRGSAFRSHILTKKSQKRKRGLKGPKSVNKADMSNIKLLLCQK